MDHCNVIEMPFDARRTIDFAIRRSNDSTETQEKMSGEFIPPSASDPPRPATYLHDVHGPANIGGGQQYVAGRDIHGNDNRVIVDADYEPQDELFQGRGFGRLIMIAGSPIAITGFALSMSAIFQSANLPPEENGFVALKIFGVPRFMLGFSAFAFGGLLAGTGQDLSKAARKRREESTRQTLIQTRGTIMPGTGATYDFRNVQGSVNAGSGRQYTAARDQIVREGDDSSEELVNLLATLHVALNRMRLTADERAAAQRELGTVRNALERDEPDREVAAGHLQRFTESLRQAGALATAGTTVTSALTVLAERLGLS
ncbi:hypothetical protein [Streptomyces sp. NPDC101234]|uniref:hypothetical protein n=1 Tax=Streptomyces sp. NPDC101234 TaxID=3366138 RepID=UPI0037FD5814